MKVYALTHVGRVRSVNQDSYYLPAAGENFAVVADGMGGHKAGEIASKIAVEEFSRWLRCAPRPNEDSLRYAIAEANRSIYLKAKAEPDKAGMGTTITALWVDASRIFLAHVGDSRAYLLRNGKMTQLSKDHSLVQEMVRLGGLNAEDAKHHPDKNIITRAIGVSEDIKIDFFEYRLQEGDKILMCTDGLSNMVEDTEMFRIVKSSRDVVEAVERLIQEANNNGGNDNIGVVVAEPFPDEVNV